MFNVQACFPDDGVSCLFQNWNVTHDDCDSNECRCDNCNCIHIPILSAIFFPSTPSLSMCTSLRGQTWRVNTYCYLKTFPRSENGFVLFWRCKGTATFLTPQLFWGIFPKKRHFLDLYQGLCSHTASFHILLVQIEVLVIGEIGCKKWGSRDKRWWNIWKSGEKHLSLRKV